MRPVLFCLAIIAVAAPALALEGRELQFREDYGTELFYDGALQYYYYIPCPTYSWFWNFRGWEPGDVVGAWFKPGDQGTGGFDPLNPYTGHAIEQFRVGDYGGYGIAYPGLFTVEFDIYGCDENGCPTTPSLWNSGPVETAFGWNYIVPESPVCMSYGEQNLEQFLITATHTGSNGDCPWWMCDDISHPLAHGCDMIDGGGLPAVYPRTSTHSGIYESGGNPLCPPLPFCDSGDTTQDCSQYGYVELAWRIYTAGCDDSRGIEVSVHPELPGGPGSTCTTVGDTLIYEIYFGPGADGQGSLYEGCLAIQHLPDEVEYLYDELSGVYDPGPPQTLTWDLGDNYWDPGDMGFAWLVTCLVRPEVCNGDSIMTSVSGNCANCWYGDEDANTIIACDGHVPRAILVLPDGSGEAPTIQAGIDKACTGDSVMLGSGIYHEHDIVMRPGVHLIGQAGDPDSVTIDADYMGRVAYCESIDATTRIEGITFTHGQVSGHGGAMYMSYSSPTIARCVFADNAAVGAGNDAGAIRLHYSSPDLIECIFSNNHADDDAGAVYCRNSSSPTIEYCLFTGNASTDKGGAILCYDNSHPLIHHCTFYWNFAGYGSGIASMNTSHVYMENNIIAFGIGGGAAFCATGGEINLQCCDVYGNLDGDWIDCIELQQYLYRNFSEDPLFCNAGEGDFHLEAESPCALEQQPTCLQVGAYGTGCDYSGVEPADGSEDFSGIMLAGPNPGPAIRRLEYAVSGCTGSSSLASLRVFDTRGRLVRTLVEGSMTAGRHSTMWDGLDERGRPCPAGVYFIRLEVAGDPASTAKFVLVR